MQEWLTEKKEITEEWDETGVLSKKDSLIPYRVFVSRQYAQHRQMENELEFNNERVKQVFQVIWTGIVFQELSLQPSVNEVFLNSHCTVKAW
ncbi:unnamed protein product [Trichobilharzia regenti]|nr:unnamed protein product [Trichobilharzia regenti]